MKYFLKMLLPMGLTLAFISCSSDDNTIQDPDPPIEEELTVTLNISDEKIPYKDYVELIVTNSEKETNPTYQFTFDKPNIAEVETIGDKYYVNALQIGEATLSVGYKDAKATASIKVVEREDAIDFNFISIVDNKHALPYLRLTGDREEQKAAEAYIHKQLVKYNSPYTRKAVELPEDADYLNYLSAQSEKDQVGFMETLYGSAAQGYLLGYETLQDAREFIDASLLPLGFKPLDDSMYTTSMYAYTYDQGENRIILVINAYENNTTNQKSLRYITGPLW